MRLHACEAAAERLRRASALHESSDASVRKAALDQVDRTTLVRLALTTLLAEMDQRQESRQEPCYEPRHDRLADRP